MIKELEDYTWFPKMFRRFQVDFIGSMSKWFNIYQPLVPVMQEMILENNLGTIQDLCSGSGLPALYFRERTPGIDKMILSDKFPPVFFKDTTSVEYRKAAQDVLVFHPREAVCYTMFNSFHHFPVREQKELVNKMVLARSPFLFAEILEPGLFILLKIIFTTTVLQLLLMPFVKPFSLLRLCFTYIIPVNVFTITYDGIISVFKSKTLQQYRLLLAGVGNTDYEINIHKINNWKGGLVYIHGRPIKQ